jgi:hypothetical protein
MGLVVTQFFIFPVKRYYLYDVASTTVGFDGTVVTTLYVTSSGSWSPDVTICVPCGNGTIERDRGEECDGTNFDGATCQSKGFPGGSLKCGPTCTIDTLGCSNNDPATCGDGVRQSTEVCDPKSTDALPSCTSINPKYSGGVLGCTTACQLDESRCTQACGNGVIDGNEQCDGAARVPQYAGKQCKDLLFSDKTWPFNTPSYYKGGSIGCKVDCTIDLRACTIPPGCYYTPPSSPASPGSFVCY